MGLATYWKQHRRTIGTVLLCIPCINFWTQFLFSTPSYSSTEAVLQVEGLVCALMLAVALGLPGTVSVSELRAADQFFGWFRDPAGPPPTPEEEAAAAYYKTIIAFWRERPPSFLFGYYLAISGFCLSVAILVIIVQYVYLSQARGLSPPGTDLSTTMLYYYRANVLVFIAVLGLIGAGIVTFFNAVCFMLYIKWPDYAVMYGFNGDNGTTDFTVYDSVNKLVVALAITVAVMATLSGMAQVFIFRASPQGQKGGAKVAPGGDEDEGGDDGAGEDEDEGGGKRHMRPMFGARTHDGGDDGARVKAGGGGRGGGGVGGGDVVKAGGGRSGGSGEVPAAAADGGSGKLRQPAEMDS